MMISPSQNIMANHILASEIELNFIKVGGAIISSIGRYDNNVIERANNQ